MEPFGIIKRLAGCASQLVLPSGFCRLESFDEDLSLGMFRDLSLGNLGRLAPAGWDFRLESFAWELPFKIARFESVNWKLSLGIFRLGNFA